eukprot:TRINITY_DN2962_c0_g1_i3.p1 TRINITY_DN2962_c0_g1~~TRINITY_DN2962_c0_g1_i3.p1  ORF type:complete len:1725 (+),score=737.07 TRINITY_DN2962_c0_g1_i3:604-5778(+)
MAQTRMSLKGELYYRDGVQHAIFKYSRAKNPVKLDKFNKNARPLLLSDTKVVLATDETSGDGTPVHLSHRVKAGLSVDATLLYELNPSLKIWQRSTPTPTPTTSTLLGTTGNAATVVTASADKGLNVSGQTKPTWDLSAGCPANFSLGPYVVLTSCKVDIYARKGYYGLEATAIVTLPNSNPLDVAVKGLFDDNVITVAGSVAGAQWKVLKSNDIVVNAVSMNFTYRRADNTPNSGWIAGEFDLLNTKFGLNTSLTTVPKGKAQFAFAAYSVKPLDLQSFAPASVPSVPVKSAVVVVSNYKGSFDIVRSSGPVQTVSVIAGANLFCDVDLTQVPALQGLSSLGQSNVNLNFIGRIGKDDFEVSAALDNLNVGDNLVLSNTELSISNADPVLSLSSEAVATVFDSQLSFSSILSWGKGGDSKEIKLVGTQEAGTTWKVAGVTLKDLELKADLTLKSSAYESKVFLGATFQPKDLAMRIEFDMDKVKGDKGQVALAGYLPESTTAAGGSTLQLNTVPGFAALPADLVAQQAGFVLANYEGTYDFKTSTVEFMKGLNLYATLDLAQSSKPELKNLATLLGNEGKPSTIVLEAHLSSKSAQFEATLTDLPVSKRLLLASLDLRISSKTPFIALTANATAVLPPKTNNQLQQIQFLTDVTIADSAWTLTGSTETPWVFGKTSVTGLIVDATVSIADGKKTLTDATLTGNVVKNKLDLTVSFDLNRDATDNENDIALVAYSGADVNLKTLPGLEKVAALEKVVLDKAVFVLATYEGVYKFENTGKFTPPVSSITVHDGLTFVAEADFTATPVIRSIPGSEAVPSVVTLSGVIADEVTLNATLGDLVLKKDVTLTSAVLSITSQEPHLTLSAAVSALLPGNTDATKFLVSGVVSEDTWAVKGQVATPWIIKMGKKSLTIKAVTLSLSKADPIKGSITGAIVINDKTTIDISVKYPSPASGKGVQIQGSIKGSVTLGEALKPLGTPTWSTSNPIAKTLTSTTFTGAMVRIETSPPSIRVAGSMIIFGDAAVRVGAAAISSGDGWGFTAGAALGQDFKFSAITSTAAPLDDVKFAQAKLVLTTVDLQNVDLFLDGSSVSTVAGLTFDARLPMNGKGLEMIQKWTKVDAVVVQAQFATSAKEFTLRAGIEGNFKITKDITITNAGLFLKIAGSRGLSVGLDCTVQTALSSRPQDKLQFWGSIYVSPVGAGFETQMQTPWVEPFGARGLTIQQSAITMEFSYAAGVPTRFGIAGGLQIGKVSGSAVILADLVNIQQSMVRGELKNIDLGKLIAATTNYVVPGTLSKTTTRFGFQRMLVYANMGTAPLKFNNQVYQPGYRFQVDEFNFFNVLRGSCMVNVEMTKGIAMSAHVMPFTLGKGKLLAVSGFQGPKSNATAAVTLMKGSPPSIGVSGSVTLFNVANLAINVNFTDSEAVADIAFKTGIFDFRVYLAAEGQMPTPDDFVFSGEINNEIHKYLAQAIPQALDGFIKDSNEEYNKLIAKHDKNVADTKAEIAKHEAELAALKKTEQQHLEKPKKKLSNAISDLERKKAKVNSLQSKIDSKKAELKASKGWKKIAHRAKLKVEIKALEAAKWTANKALDLAIKLVSKLRKEIADHGVQVNPKILALEGKIGVLEAKLNNHVCAAGAAAKIVKGANKLSKWISDHAKDLTGLFAVENLKVSGRLSAIKKGDLADISATVIFLGKRKTFKFNFGFNAMDDLVSDVTETLTSDIEED